MYPTVQTCTVQNGQEQNQNLGQTEFQLLWFESDKIQAELKLY